MDKESFSKELQDRINLSIDTMTDVIEFAANNMTENAKVVDYKRIAEYFDLLLEAAVIGKTVNTVAAQMESNKQGSMN